MNKHPSQHQTLAESRLATIAALQQIDDSTLAQLTRLTLPKIRAIQQEVAQVLPAGNLPAFVLSGLVKLKGRRVTPDRVQQDVAALLRGISLLPRGLYGVFVVGPAAVLYAYQKLLQLSGKDLDSAFPQGAWQFYIEFGLREDAAHHTNETVGFQRLVPAPIDPVTEASAWVCAAMETLYHYDDLLNADWTERVMLRLLLEEAIQAGGSARPPFATLVRDWHAARPYHRPADGSDYLPHRRAVFQNFLQERLAALPATAQKRFHQQYQTRQKKELAAYQEQMSILAALEPDRYHEQKAFIPLWRASVAFVWKSHTYVLPACQKDERGSPLYYPPSPDDGPPRPLYALPGGELCDANSQSLAVDRSGRVWHPGNEQLLGHLRPPSPETIHSWLAPILSTRDPGTPPTLDLLLAESPRSLQPQLREKLPVATRAELDVLRRAPIIVNWDPRPHQLPLAYIRRGRRGIGDHALTICRTGQSAVFDQSHVFFDGTWGMAVSEVMTGSAIHWYSRIANHPAAPTAFSPAPLILRGTSEVKALAQPHRQPREASAESGNIDMRGLRSLRKWLRQRGVTLTVNDLLLLYRFFHAAQYRPSPALVQELQAFRSRAQSTEARAALQSIQDTWARFRETNPALLIPMDASNVSPQERIFPTTFRNPLIEIGDRFAAAQEQYRALPISGRGSAARRHEIEPESLQTWAAFDQARRELLAYLKTFGELLDALKAVTMRGESFNTATIRLLAHLPTSMQHLLDQIPQRIGVLNEIIKGNEVFSNVGRVAPGTFLTRFASAKDDGETKELVWGVLTDDRDQMWISLRDFRPFVPQLLALGETALADSLAQDYLDSYVTGLNRFVADLGDIIALKG
ncbi:MAG: hypothetical protein GY832_00710 [Chloroflexi bacterium]|nr:hypothetical protein [Chloroflexota bacterium]